MKENIEDKFKRELIELLEKYKAEMYIERNKKGDNSIAVYFPFDYDLSKSPELILGNYVAYA